MSAHIELPSWFWPRPTPHSDPGTIAAFERLFAATVERGAGTVINYTLRPPKWQFLCYLCDHKEIVLHGSGQPDIVEFEPRQSNDVAEFGNRRAVYAASDGIWPIYFAVVDRDGGVTSLVNSCARVLGSDGSRSEPYYFFSINGDALSRQPWRHGTIYLLPRQNFEQQAPQPYRGLQLEIAQWASPIPVRALAPAPRRARGFPVPGADSCTRPPSRQRTRCAGPRWVPLAGRLTSPSVGGMGWHLRGEATSVTDGSMARQSARCSKRRSRCAPTPRLPGPRPVCRCIKHYDQGCG